MKIAPHYFFAVLFFSTILSPLFGCESLKFTKDMYTGIAYSGLASFFVGLRISAQAFQNNPGKQLSCAPNIERQPLIKNWEKLKQGTQISMFGLALTSGSLLFISGIDSFCSTHQLLSP